MGGQKVAESSDSQFVNIASLSKGVYVVRILGKNGSQVAQKFLTKVSQVKIHKRDLT